MTRLASGGFETGTLTADEGGVVTGTALSVQSTTKRSGTYALKVLPASTNGYITFDLPPAVTAGKEHWARAYLRVVTRPSATVEIMALRNNATGNGQQLMLLTTGEVELRAIGGATVGTSAVLALNTWYRVEISGKWDTDTHEGRLDGVTYAGPASHNFWESNEIRMGCITSVVSGEWYFDDWAVNSEVNNTTGTNRGQNSFPGAGSIVHLRPNAAGDTATGTATGAATGWECVDEVTPDDATTYWALVATGDILEVNIDATSGMDTITVVQVGLREAGATAAAHTHLTRFKTQASGTVGLSAAIVTALATYTTHDDTAGERYYPPGGTFTHTPQTGNAALTPALLDTAQIGASTDDANPDVRVTTLWLLVDYVPTVVVASRPMPARMSRQAVHRAAVI